MHIHTYTDTYRYTHIYTDAHTHTYIFIYMIKMFIRKKNVCEECKHNSAHAGDVSFQGPQY